MSGSSPHRMILNWRKVPEEDFWSYARAFHMAAKKLAGTLEAGSGPFSQFDACPAVFLYRHAVELQLKALVLGAGSNFLATRPDPVSVSKSVSLSWLAQFVSQIVTALHWERDFQCEGVESLADFSAVIEDLNSVDPVPIRFVIPKLSSTSVSLPGRWTHCWGCWIRQRTPWLRRGRCKLTGRRYRTILMAIAASGRRFSERS